MTRGRGPSSISGAGLLQDMAMTVHVCRRLAAIDPPVLRSLIVELTRISAESAAAAAQAGTAEAAALANRNAQRTAAARAALASAEATA